MRCGNGGSEEGAAEVEDEGEPPPETGVKRAGNVGAAVLLLRRTSRRVETEPPYPLFRPRVLDGGHS